MSYPVLVINADFQPYDIWSWQKTMKKLLSSDGSSISPLYDEDGKLIRHSKLIRDSKGKLYDLPAVVKLKTFVNMYNRKIPYSKVNVYARDNYVCKYCGKVTQHGDRTVDHVIPRTLWNKNRQHYNFRLNDFTNVVTSCMSCNARKGGRTPEQAGMRIIGAKPHHPNRAQIYRNKLLSLKNRPLQWEPFLNFYVASR